MNKKQAHRLLNVARSLRESPSPKHFTMECLVHDEHTLATLVDYEFSDKGFCGTPACALGHYAARSDLQKLMKIRTKLTKTKYGDSIESDVAYVKSGRSIHVDEWKKINEHFGITQEESSDLFGWDGCNAARTPQQAAKYIERFVANKLKDQAKAKKAQNF